MQALQWWKEGNLASIAEYCRKDVEITRDVYLFGHREGYLLFTNKAGQAGKGCGGVVGKEPLERLSPKKVPPSPEAYGVIEFLSGVQAVSLGKWGNAG